MAERAAPRSRPAAGGLIRPMLATAGPVPVGPGWAFEVKFDGVRAIGYAGPGGLTLYSRNDRDISRSYPEVAALASEPRCGRRRRARRAGRARPPGLRPAAAPHARHDTHRGADRAGAGAVRRVRPPAPRRSVAAGAALRPTARAVGPTGSGAARAAGAGQLHRHRRRGGDGRGRAARPGGCGREAAGLDLSAGRRSRAWIKTPIRHTAEVIIAGWSPSSGNAHVLGALLLAAHDPDGELVYVGDVGTGFTDAARRRLAGAACGRCTATIHRSPGRSCGPAAGRGRPPSRGPVHWVAPRLVGEIEYRSFTLNRTTAGGSFRHPSWRGLRPDREPRRGAPPDIELGRNHPGPTGLPQPAITPCPHRSAAPQERVLVFGAHIVDADGDKRREQAFGGSQGRE